MKSPARLTSLLIEKLTKEIEVAEREQDKLFATGNPFELGSKARAAKEDLEKLSQEEGKLADMHNKLQTAYDGVNDKINEYSQKADEATASTSRLSRIGGMVGKAIGSIATFGKNAAKSLTGAKKSSSGFGLSLGTLVKYGFGIRSLYVLVNKLRSALVDGFKNLSQYSGETNGSISMLWSSLERLKNSLATAFAPILTVVAPILSKFIDMLSTAASYVSMFFSFLSGKSTYTRAIAVQKNYAASLGDTASAAKDAADATEDAAKAAEDYLSPLDDLNKFTAEDTTSKASSGNSGSSGGGVDPGQMFEDVPIESNIEKIFQKIKDLIKSGDFEGLGEMMADAINRGLKKVKKAISWDNVGPTVTYFVTAFTRTFNSLVDNIDWDLLGRTIGTGINTIVNTLDLFYTGIDWKNLGSKFAEGVNGVVYEVDWAKLGQFIGHKLLALPTVIVGFIENLDWSALSKAASTLVLNFLDTLIEFIHNIDWSKIVTNIQDALTNIQWIAIAEKILELLGYALGSITGALARLIGNLIAQGASEAYQYFEDKIKEAGGNVVDGILLGILDALLGIGSWIVDNVFKPILDGFKNAFGIHSPSTVMQEQGHYIIEGLLLGITDFLSKIKKKFEEIRNLVTEKMDNIKSSAVSKVNEMKKGLSDGVERIKESFRSGFSTLPKGIRQRGNTFEGRFMYKGVSYTVQASTITKTQKEMTDLKYKLEHGLYVKKEKITLMEWYETWLEEYKKNRVKIGTYTSYEKYYKSTINNRLGNKELSEIRGEHIQKLYNDMVKEGYAISSIKIVSAILNGCLQQAMKNGLIERNPVKLAELPRQTGTKKERTAMTKEQQDLFMKYAEESYLYHFFSVMLRTGMRKGEMQGLKYSDIDKKQNVIHVRRTLKYIEGKGYFEDTPKTRTSTRDIPLTAAITEHIEAQRKYWGFKVVRMDQYLFCNENGDPISRERIQGEIDRIIKRIKSDGYDFPRITSHVFRHTFATRAIEAGMPPQVLKTILGHSSLAMTMDLYSHVLPDTKADEMQKIANVF